MNFSKNYSYLAKVNKYYSKYFVKFKRKMFLAKFILIYPKKIQSNKFLFKSHISTNIC